VKPFPIEELVDRCGSRFAVVVAAAKRAKQIKEGAPPLVNLPTRNPLTIALHEIAAGLVEITEEVVVVETPAVVAEETVHEPLAPEVVEELISQSIIDDIVEGPDDSFEADLDEEVAEDLDEELEEETDDDDDEELEEVDLEDDEEWEEE
jgi:DNA-directed RNA polymerase subunit omega